ncbi:MAG: proline--tRNA ligase [Candidatus Sericytochromatia bacterium]|nr:proline--tRNA ligase [Candidatus Sericytochromatia bacterium]
MMAKITPRASDYSRWYLDIINHAKLADYAPVKGCMVIRPNGYALWENMQRVLDQMFKDTGHVNAYFPMFIPESFLKKEAEHVEGFAPETAVVTHGGGKQLEEPLIVRPTSETIIWDMYKKWIQSYRDLPMLINQWANVVRWEMRTRLFLRTTEFLWQEGHTAHATAEEAEAETRQMLDVYAHFAEEYMAMPVIKGRKSEAEKFAGADVTYCIEAMMQDRKALQAGTSHNLGQNFAKAFEVRFQDRDGELKHPYSTSWGVSTRLIGALIMAHSDDQGLILPPRLAPTQVVIVPIARDEDERASVLAAAENIQQQLKGVGVRVKLDDDPKQKPGWKFAEYELLGVPLRLELGPRDVAGEQVMVARRDIKGKTALPLDGLAESISALLESVQQGIFERARDFRDSHIFEASSYDELKTIIGEEKGWVKAFWSGDPEDEARVKEETKATIRCIPFDQPETLGSCIVSGKPARYQVLFAKAY